MAAEKIVEFLSKNGLPPQSIYDPTFISMIKSVDPQFQLPDLSMIKSTIEQTAKNVSTVGKEGLVAVTIDIVRNGSSLFVVYSAHFINAQFSRSSEVYMRLLPSAPIHCLNILKNIKMSIFEGDIITNDSDTDEKFSVIVRDPAFLIPFHKTGLVNKSLTCFYIYLSDFVRTIFSIDVIQKAINNLKLVLKKMLSFQGVKEEFEKASNERCPEFLNEIESSETWVEITRFVINWAKMNSYIQSMTSLHQFPYIEKEEIEYLTTVEIVLKETVNIMNEMSEENNTVSQIIPKVFQLDYVTATISPVLPIRSIFEKILGVFINPTFADNYFGFATLLDPRFAFSPKYFDQTKWENLKFDLLMEIVGIQTTGPESNKMQIYKKIEEELRIFEISIPTNRNICDPFEWWAKYGIRMPQLSQYARRISLIPASVIDGDYYFGKSGIMCHLVDRTDEELVGQMLKIAGRNSTYKGYGIRKKTNIENVIIPQQKMTTKRKYMEEAEFEKILMKVGMSETFEEEIREEKQLITNNIEIATPENVKTEVDCEELGVKEEIVEEEIIEGGIEKTIM